MPPSKNNSNDKAASEHIHKQWLGMLYITRNNPLIIQQCIHSLDYDYIFIWCQLIKTKMSCHQVNQTSTTNDENFNKW